MEPLPIIDIPKDAGRSTQNAISPFRYPGGKAFLAEHLRRRISDRLVDNPRTIAEPFCGGAGAALNLLADGNVAAVLMNDADPRIYSAWYAMLNESGRFVDEIQSAQLTMDEWYKHRDRVSKFSGSDYCFEVGFSTFYINRTTRSGIITKSGPIGGYNQSGKWKIDARFNKVRIAKQISWLSAQRDNIQLTNKDGLSFLDNLRRLRHCEKIYFFIDPPYVEAGGRLYYDGMSEAKHVALSDMLVSGDYPHWTLTYDDAPLIRELYHDLGCAQISVNYSLQSKRKEREIIVESRH